MKTLRFRPLRRNKKSGKITVASYMQWHKVKCADVNNFVLLIDDEYKSFPEDEYVYDSKGDLLFWVNYNPERIQMINPCALIDGEAPPYPEMWKTDYEMYSAKGLDVQGTPVFSHLTANHIVNAYADMKDFQPLTVKVVVWWFGWFLYQLKNSDLKFKQ